MPEVQTGYCSPSFLHHLPWDQNPSIGKAVEDYGREFLTELGSQEQGQHNPWPVLIIFFICWSLVLRPKTFRALHSHPQTQRTARTQFPLSSVWQVGGLSGLQRWRSRHTLPKQTQRASQNTSSQKTTPRPGMGSRTGEAARTGLACLYDHERHPRHGLWEAQTTLPQTPGSHSSLSDTSDVSGCVPSRPVAMWKKKHNRHRCLLILTLEINVLVGLFT